MKGQCLIGTSGWVYPHWRGIFYPPSLPQSRWFEHYSQHFSTVEINYSFYRLPSEEAFRRWRKKSPEGFIYAVKANRYITHVKRLKDAAEPLARFLGRARLLEDKLGPILYQLPPRWRANPERLISFAELLPPDLSHVFEFRDPRWFIQPVFQILKTHNLSFCIYSMPGIDCPLWVTSELVYIRFHGSLVLYGGSYSHEELASWAGLAKDFLAHGDRVHAHFNNDAFGNAVRNAQELRALIGEREGELPSPPMMPTLKE